MSRLAFRFVTPFGKRSLRCKYLSIGFVFIAACARIAHGQDNRKVSISFVPPPLENATYSLGIYETKSGKLVRRLQEIAPESAFTVGLNGLMTSWDGKDDAGKVAPPGRYAARGYAVGPMKIEGVDILGNDWAKDDESLRVERVQAIALVPEDEGLVVVVSLGLNLNRDCELLRYAGADGKLLWHKSIIDQVFGTERRQVLPNCTVGVENGSIKVLSAWGQFSEYHVSDGVFIDGHPDRTANATDAAKTSPGKDNTQWRIEDGILSQYTSSGEVLRRLTPTENERLEGVAASAKSDRLYLLEGRQRVRGLSWAGTQEENGKTISSWKTFFERNIKPPDVRLDNVVFKGTPTVVEVTLVENPLTPGKPQKASLAATGDVGSGTYLSVADGLRLRKVSDRKYISGVLLRKSQTAGLLTFLQADSSQTWDEFSIEGAKDMMAFDAGEFEMTAEGEKTHAEKPAEPPDL